MLNCTKDTERSPAYFFQKSNDPPTQTHTRQQGWISKANNLKPRQKKLK